MIGSVAFPGRLLALVGVAALAALPARAVEYDGNWSFALTCPATGGQPAFTDRFTAPIAQNAFSRTRSTRNAQGVEDSSRWSGRIEGGQMSVAIDRTRGAERWALRFAGPAASDTRFDLPGGLFVGERQLRPCRLVAEAVTPAPGSLAATAPSRMRQLVAELTAQLAALREAAEARADELRTELDMARFEGQSMRTELTERARGAAAQAAALAESSGLLSQAQALRADLETRLRAAEGALAQMQSTATQQRSGLEARVTQAEAALAQQRSALEARVAAAETALAQAQSAAAQQRGALEARITAAEATASQALAQLRTEGEARLRAAEATIAQLRTELEQARGAQPSR